MVGCGPPQLAHLRVTDCPWQSFWMHRLLGWQPAQSLQTSVPPAVGRQMTKLLTLVTPDWVQFVWDHWGQGWG